jgi:hypothetical protein
MTETYKIIRFYRDKFKRSRVIKIGLTLEEAKKHCSKESTHHPSPEWYKCGYFDGFTKEN